MDKEILLLITNYAIRIMVLVMGTYLIQFIRKYNLEKWTRLAVKAAEQLYKESGMGETKKATVIAFVKEKFKVSDQELEILVEAIVKELNMLKVLVIE